MFNEPRSIGITGGIGSGKSYVSNLLRQKFGIPVYNCDAESKRLTVTDKQIREKLTQLVGSGVYDGERLVRQRLAEYLFANPEHASRINAIIHPAVLEDFKLWANRQHKPIVALESAILYESGFNKYVDFVLFVDAPKEVRLDRAMQRDTVSAEKIKARMQMQYPELHRKLADFILDNSKTDDEYLEKQIKTALHYLRNR
jgi:dephospho-CoA kinase